MVIGFILLGVSFVVTGIRDILEFKDRRARYGRQRGKDRKKRRRPHSRRLDPPIPGTGEPYAHRHTDRYHRVCRHAEHGLARFPHLRLHVGGVLRLPAGHARGRLGFRDCHLFTTAPFNFAADYGFAVLPLFMLLGMLAGATRVGEEAYNSIEKWTNWMPGGLMMATVGGNALFGAVSGMSTASNMVFCKIAMPELTKHGYDKNYSMGLITASGALDSLDPPEHAHNHLLHAGSRLVRSTSGGHFWAASGRA